MAELCLSPNQSLYQGNGAASIGPDQWFSKCGLWRSSSGSPGDLLAMQFSGLIQEIVGEGLSRLVLISPPGDSDACSSLRSSDHD